VITDIEKQIRQTIYKIRINISKNYDSYVCDGIISSKIGYGYSIGKNVVIISA
jgi:hypothetical protein